MHTVLKKTANKYFVMNSAIVKQAVLVFNLQKQEVKYQCHEAAG
jgi:hypothetical protein